MHFNDCLVICGYHVKLGIPSAFWLSDTLLSVFFKHPCPSGCTLQEVLSNANTSTLIDMIFSCCKAVKALCITPLFTHRLKRLYILFRLPYSFGSALHLHPFSAIYNIAFINKIVVIDFYVSSLNRKVSFDFLKLFFSDFHVFIILHFYISVNRL